MRIAACAPSRPFATVSQISSETRKETQTRTLDLFPTEKLLEVVRMVAHHDLAESPTIRFGIQRIDASCELTAPAIETEQRRRINVMLLHVGRNRVKRSSSRVLVEAAEDVIEVGGRITVLR